MKSLFFILFLLSCVLVSMGNATSTERDLQTAETVPAKDNDKFCVFHVGPHKTGTTTLQKWILGTHPPLLAALEQDNYGPGGMGGKTVHSYAGLAICMNVGDQRCRGQMLPNVRRQLKAHVEDYASRGLSMIVSSEGFDRPEIDIADLVNIITPTHKIHVVVYYRRFYDWIHSIYNQVTKPKPYQSALQRHDPFVQWLPNNLGPVQAIHSHPVYNRFMENPGIFNVSVVNMHDDPDNFNTLERFACGHMDNAPHVCELAKATKVKHDNPSSGLDWDLFRGKINVYHSIELSNSDADSKWMQIEAKFNEITDLPQLCLSPELKDKLLQISLEAEKALTPESWYNSEEGLENLKSDFEKKINTKFCSIDIEKILTSSEWQDFLTGLEGDDVEEGS